jgi:hypothetical protein
MGDDLEVKVLWNNWSQEFLANRKAKKARKGSGREAGAERSGSKTVGRRTEIGCEASQPRASGQRTAKPL